VRLHARTKPFLHYLTIVDRNTIQEHIPEQKLCILSQF
jgi:hypothetical protein